MGLLASLSLSAMSASFCLATALNAEEPDPKAELRIAGGPVPAGTPKNATPCSRIRPKEGPGEVYQ